MKSHDTHDHSQSIIRVRHLTSESEPSSSASVGALSTLFLWLSACPPPWFGPAVLLDSEWVLQVNFLRASGVSVGQTQSIKAGRYSVQHNKQRHCYRCHMYTWTTHHESTPSVAGIKDFFTVLWQDTTEAELRKINLSHMPTVQIFSSISPHSFSRHSCFVTQTPKLPRHAGPCVLYLSCGTSPEECWCFSLHLQMN